MSLLIHIRANFLLFCSPKELALHDLLLNCSLDAYPHLFLMRGLLIIAFLRLAPLFSTYFTVLSLPSLVAQKVYQCCSISVLQYHFYSKSDT